MLAACAWGAIDVENHADDVITYFVLVDQTTGDRDTTVTIANLEMYYIEDQAAESADAFVGAHGAVTDAHTDGECIHIGHGVYRIDWPDAAFDGGVGKRVQLTVVDGDDGAKTETLEVLLSPPSNVTQLDGSDVQQTTGHIHAFDDAGAALAAATPLSTASGYASDAKTAAEKIDTNTELRTLLYGSDTAGATGAALSTAQADLDTITGSDGVTLATAQGLYAPAKAGDLMGLADETIRAASFHADAEVAITEMVWNSTTDSYGGEGTYGQAAEDILADTSSTLDTLIKAIPTNDEFALRTILADDYVVVGDTIAGVTLVTTTTTNSDMITAATVEGECIDALESFKLDELMAEAVTTDLNTAVHDNSALGYLFAISDVAAYDRTEDSLQGIIDYGDVAWITATGFSTHTAANVVDNFETQSAADPTGFKVNVMEVNGTAQTANDMSGDVDDILVDTAAYDSDAEYAAAIWGAAMENSKTYAEVMQVFAAVLSGKSSIAAGEMTFVGIDGVTERLVVTVSSGARTSVDTWDGVE